MKFFVLTGAFINAGDFLITERTKQLLGEVYPECEIIEYKRNKELLPEDIELANTCDAIVYAGGPCVRKNFYPTIVPLVTDLNALTTKMVSVGIGWAGKNNNVKYKHSYKLSDKTKTVFMRMEEDAPISCRDYYTCEVLKNNGIMNVTMTGCPAWYNLTWLKTEQKDNEYKIKRICISEPANLQLYYNQCIELCEYVKNQFPHAELKFVIHRAGEKSGDYIKEKTLNKVKQLRERVEELGYSCEDISYGYEKLKVYDDCDLHIGYRVHAHIYNLSRGSISVLLEEDARGAGVNDALNIRHIKAFDKKILIPGRERVLKTSVNSLLLYEVDEWIERCINNGYVDYRNSHNQIRNSYSDMISHIRGFS